MIKILTKASSFPLTGGRSLIRPLLWERGVGSAHAQWGRIPLELAGGGKHDEDPLV